MSWFGPQPCNCPCIPSSSSESIDPCDPDSDDTMYIRIEVSGLPSSVRTGTGFDALNGTYFVPLQKNPGPPVTFELPPGGSPLAVVSVPTTSSNCAGGNVASQTGGININYAGATPNIALFGGNGTFVGGFVNIQWPTWCGSGANHTSNTGNIWFRESQVCFLGTDQIIGTISYFMPIPGPAP